MNAKCCGHRFTVGRKQFYRCLLDGAVLRSVPDDGGTCLNCGRIVDYEIARTLSVKAKLDLGSIGVVKVKVPL